MNGYRAVTPRLEFRDDFTNECPDSVYRFVLTYLLVSCADINIQDDSGATSLYVAVSRREIVMIQMLLQNRVNALITKNDGVRAGDINGARTAPETVDFEVYKYGIEQVEQFDPEWVEVL